MKYFAAQIKTAQEETYIGRAQQQLAERPENQRFIFPRRRLNIRRGGKTGSELLPVFPGYIFVETEDRDEELFRIMRKTAGFYRFLPSNQDITELKNRDLAILKHFMNFNCVAESSLVYFDDNDRIMVAEGPLKGLEGRIVKVDRRKGRAKVQLDMYTDNFTLDLAFTVMEKNAAEAEPV